MSPIRASLAALLALACFPVSSQGSVPSFEATSLTGQVVTEQKLIGQPTVLIVTPSRAAAQETRKWAQALRKNIDASKVRVRDVLSIDLPFFMSEQDALSRAREKIPKRYHDQTWLLSDGSLEASLNIPAASEDAFVLVLDGQGRVIARVKGKPTKSRMSEVQDAVGRLSG